MSHMSMVGIAYQNNHDLDQPKIVNLLVIGFFGTLRGWWNSYLTEESKDSIKNVVKKEPASPLDIVNWLTPLGTIPKPNYSSILASTYDPYALTNVHQSISLPSLPTLCPLPLLPMLCPFPPLWYQSHSFLADDNVVMFFVSSSVSTQNFGTPLLCSLLTIIGATLVIKWIPRTEL